MEYLVTMTTHVPDGTPDTAVDDIRAREAAHSQDLAAEGHLLRLWRPPLQPGEWRTLGLFDASDKADLDAVLLSMPLRIWRKDEVTPLSPHPNDPGPRTEREMTTRPPVDGSEFLTTFTVTVPSDTPGTEVDAVEARGADRAKELAERGELLRLWTLSGEGRALGLWRAHDGKDLEAMVHSLPLRGWSDVETVPLSPHPSDPGSVPR
jgi:muconolactone delta-isomerase